MTSNNRDKLLPDRLKKAPMRDEVPSELLSEIKGRTESMNIFEITRTVNESPSITEEVKESQSNWENWEDSRC